MRMLFLIIFVAVKLDFFDCQQKDDAIKLPNSKKNI